MHNCVLYHTQFSIAFHIADNLFIWIGAHNWQQHAFIFTKAYFTDLNIYGRWNNNHMASQFCQFRCRTIDVKLGIPWRGVYINLSGSASPHPHTGVVHYQGRGCGISYIDNGCWVLGDIKMQGGGFCGEVYQVDLYKRILRTKNRRGEVTDNELTSYRPEIIHGFMSSS